MREPRTWLARRRMAVSILATTACVAVAAGSSPNAALAAPQNYSHSDAYTSSSTQTVVGTKTSEGCVWTDQPVLQLAPTQTVIESRQTSIDWDTCSSVVETGVPASSDASDATDGEAAHVAATTEPACTNCGSASTGASGSMAAPPTSTQSGGYYTVWWEDLVHIDVTKTRAHLDFSYNGSCVTFRDGWGFTWWRKGTGWSKRSASAFVNPFATCNNYGRTRVNSLYVNDKYYFCSNIIYQRNEDVTIRGDYRGYMTGFVGRTTASECVNGPDLHYHKRLRRATT